MFKLHFLLISITDVSVQLVCKSNPRCLCLNSQPYHLNEVELLSLKINTIIYMEVVSEAVFLREVN